MYSIQYALSGLASCAQLWYSLNAGVCVGGVSILQLLAFSLKHEAQKNGTYKFLST